MDELTSSEVQNRVVNRPRPGRWKWTDWMFPPSRLWDCCFSVFAGMCVCVFVCVKGCKVRVIRRPPCTRSIIHDLLPTWSSRWRELVVTPDRRQSVVGSPHRGGHSLNPAKYSFHCLPAAHVKMSQRWTDWGAISLIHFFFFLPELWNRDTSV